MRFYFFAFLVTIVFIFTISKNAMADNFLATSHGLISNNDLRSGNEKLLNTKIIDMIDESNLSDNTLMYNINSSKTLEDFEKKKETSINSGLEQIHNLIPKEYSELAIATRSDEPVVKYSMGYDIDDQQDSTSISTNATNIVLDYLLSSITNDILSINILKSDKSKGIALQLRPIKNLMFEFSQSEENKRNSTDFSIRVFPTKTTAITFKTTDNATETQTGIEFQMKF